MTDPAAAPAIPLYFDESGYTGRALLDPVQPHFVVASSTIGEDEAAAILAEAFPDHRGDELKATDVWRRPRLRVRLPHFAGLLTAHVDRIFLHHIDKRFCVLTKLVDHLIEPIAYETGHDFYRNSYAPRYCNWLHLGLSLSGGPALYDAFILPFYEFARNPDQPRLDQLVLRLTWLETSGPEELRPVFGMARLGAETFHQRSDIEAFRDVLEVQLASVFASVGWWHRRIPDHFAIRHDASSNFFRQGEMWAALTSPEVPPQLHDFAAAGVLEFPLRVESTAAVDSRHSRAVQLMDLVAGAGTRLYAEPADVAGVAERIQLLEAGFGELNVGGIAPGDELIDGPPPLRNQADLVDQLAAVIARSRL